MNFNTLFIIFSSFLVICALMVIVPKHPVFFFGFFVGGFVFSSFLLFLLECKSLASPFVWIYVGAITVLFLFVIMMIDTNSINFSKYYSIRLEIKNFFNEKYTVLLKKDVEFLKFYKERFFILYYLLPFIRLISFLFVIYQSKLLMIDYGSMFESILNLGQVDANLQKAYEQKYSFFYTNFLVCLSSIFLIFFLDIYAICKVNNSLMDRFLKITLLGLKTLAMLMSVSTFPVYGPVESTLLTQFIHTKTALGRGFDYEIGSILSKLKGDLIAGSLSRESMLEAVEKYAGDSKIVDSTVLSEIITDKKYSKELTKTLTYIQRVQLGVRVW